MIKWFRAQSTQVKMMILIIVMLVAGIILRWDVIKQQAGDALRSRFSTEEN